MKSVPTLEEHETRFKDVHPTGVQDLFTHIVARAKTRGMQVNAQKTGLLCVSGAISYKARAHLYDEGGQEIKSEAGLKVLGFRFDSDGGIWTHVNYIKGRSTPL